MILLIGNTGVGKTTIESKLIENHGFSPVTVYTNRTPRKSDPGYYRFTSRKMIDNDNFIKYYDDGDVFYAMHLRDWASDSKTVLSLLTAKSLKKLIKELGETFLIVYIERPDGMKDVDILDRGMTPAELEFRRSQEEETYDYVINKLKAPKITNISVSEAAKGIAKLASIN